MSDASRRWDYRTVRIKPSLLGTFDTETLDAALQREGRDGWELVNALQTGPLQPILLFFKRPR